VIKREFILLTILFITIMINTYRTRVKHRSDSLFALANTIRLETGNLRLHLRKELFQTDFKRSKVELQITDIQVKH